MITPDEIKIQDAKLLSLDNDEIKTNIKLRSSSGETITAADMAAYREKIAGRIIVQHGYAWVGDAKGEFLRYFNGVWCRNADQALSACIRAICNVTGYTASGEFIESVQQLIRERRQFIYEQFDNDRSVVNYTNGMLSLRSWDLSQHQQDLCFVQIPHRYVKDARYPFKFMGWLQERFDDDWKVIDFILKAIGVSMTRDVGFQKLFIMKDGFEHRKSGKTGKGTLIYIVRGLIGAENCASVSLHRLAQKFGPGFLHGKLVNFYTDVSTHKQIPDASQIKILIDDTIDCEIKGKQQFTANNVTHHWFSMNAWPGAEGMDLAYCRRFSVAEWNKKVPSPPILNFHETILADEAEVEGIISLCIDALKELYDEKEFKMQTPQEIMDMILQETNVVYQHIKRECLVGPEYFCTKEEYYTAYIEFAEEAGVAKVLAKNALTNEIYACSATFKSSKITIEKGGKQEPCYVGFTLKDNVRINAQIKIPPKPITSLDTFGAAAVPEPVPSLKNEPVEEEHVTVTPVTSFLIQKDDEDKLTSVILNLILKDNGVMARDRVLQYMAMDTSLPKLNEAQFSELVATMVTNRMIKVDNEFLVVV